MAKTKEEYNAYMKKYMLKRYHERMDRARQKLGGECCKCGSKENLQIDHIDPSAKSWTMAKMWSVNDKSFEEELSKCQLLCQPCHNLKTLDQNGMKPARGTHGTLSSYRYCKCRLCKDAQNAYMRDWKRRKKHKKQQGL